MLFLTASVQAQNFVPAAFVNGLTLSGGLPHMSSGSARALHVGPADLYYDSNRNEWWGRSEHSGSGDALPYETRVQRFANDFAGSAALSNFSLDADGPVVLRDGGFLADECGPAVRNFTSTSNLTIGAATKDYLTSILRSGREGPRGVESSAVVPNGKIARLQIGATHDNWSAVGGGTCGVFTRNVQFEVPTSTAIGEYAYPLKTFGKRRDSVAMMVVGGNRELSIVHSNASDATELDVQKSTSRPMRSAVMRREVIDLMPLSEQNASTAIAESNAAPSPTESPFMLMMCGLGAVVFIARRRLS